MRSVVGCFHEKCVIAQPAQHDDAPIGLVLVVEL